MRRSIENAENTVKYDLHAQSNKKHAISIATVFYSFYCGANKVANVYRTLIVVRGNLPIKRLLDQNARQACESVGVYSTLPSVYPRRALATIRSAVSRA